MHRNGLEHDRRHRLLRPLRAASAGSIGRGYGGGVTAQRTIAARRWLVGWVAGEGSRAATGGMAAAAASDGHGRCRTGMAAV